VDTEVAGPEPIEHKGETLHPESRTFIPSRVSDNRYLANTNYVRRLQQLPEPLRSQMLYGDFAAGADDHAYQIIPTEWVKDAQKRWTERSTAALTLSTIGVDPARGGNDETVLAPRYGDWFGELTVKPGGATPDGAVVAQEVVPLVKGACTVHVDAIGIGSSVVDQLTQLLIHPQVNPVVGSEGSEYAVVGGNGEELFKMGNLRAEMWWKFRALLDPTTDRQIALPPDKRLLADLTAPRYKVRSGRIYVESKEELIKRLGRSPDRGDAVVYASVDELPPKRNLTSVNQRLHENLYR